MKLNFTPPTFRTLFALAALVVSSGVSAHAQRFWTDGTASYNNAGNWSGGVIPSGEDAIVNNGGTVLINSGDPAWTVNDIRAGQATGNGAYIQNGSTVTLNGWFRMAVDTGTAGSYTINGGTLNANPDFHVSEKGTGVLNIYGGIVNHNGGGAIIIGDRGADPTSQGTVNHTNGVFNSNQEMWIGQGDNVNFGGSLSGTYNMSGTGLLNINNWLAVGRNRGQGLLNMTGGTIVKAGGGNIVLGGNAGNGTINQSGGAIINTNTETWLAEHAGGIGIWNLSGGTATLGTLLLSIGGGGSGDGTFNLSGTGLLTATEIRTNGIGASIFSFNGGTLQAGADNPTFMHDLSAANILAAGATVDSAGHTITIPQTLTDGGGGGGFTKIGAGTVTLSGANTFSGPSIVKAGKLIVTTDSLVTSDVVVSNSAGFGVNVSAANAQVNRANFTLAGANTLDFGLANFGNPAFAPLNVTGTLNVNGTTTVNISDTFPQVGQFPLIKYAARTGSGTFVLGTVPVGVSAVLINNTGNSSIDLKINSTALIRWDGRVAGGAWDINTSTNWTDFVSGLPAKYTEGAAVYFDDFALGTPTVNLGVTVNPGTVIVTNDTLTYALTGNGKINGATSLTKQGSNTFTISTTNSYTGPTIISGGTLSINTLANGGSPSAIGSAATNTSNLDLDGGVLSYTGPSTSTDRGFSLTRSSGLNLQNDLTLNGAVTPTANANFLKSGPGTLSYKRPGANTLSAGGGGGAFSVSNGGIVMDGSAGAQTNTITGEVWLGSGTNAGNNTSLLLTNTTLNVSSWFAVARGSGTFGNVSTATLNNSKLTSGNLSIGFDNGIAGTMETGSLALNGTSTYTNNGDSNIGESGGAQATITLNDSSVFFSNNRAMVGWHNNATGAMVIANSAKVVVNAWFSIGNEGGVGSVVVQDNGSLTLPGGSSDLNINDVNGGIGSLLITNNGSVRAVNAFVGKGVGSVGSLTVAGGSLAGKIGDGVNVILGNGGGSTATFNLNGGRTITRSVTGAAGATTTFNFNGGVLAAGAGALNSGFFPAGLTLADVMLGGAIIDSSNLTVTVDQPLSGDVAGDGGLTKLGTGTLILNGANTYTNTTTVSAGALGGNGSIAGPVLIQANATLSPGASGIGTLTINNNLTLAGNVAVDVNENVSPSNDLVVVTGALNNTGIGNVKVTNLGTNTLAPGDTFTLFSKPVVNGNALTVLPSAGVTWTNRLAVDGSIRVLAVGGAPSFVPGGVTRSTNGTISLTASGIPGTSYRLWASTNVALAPVTTTWTLISSGTVPSNPFTLPDTSATNFPMRFYVFTSP